MKLEREIKRTGVVNSCPICRPQCSSRRGRMPAPVWLPKSDTGRGRTRTAGHRIPVTCGFGVGVAGFEPAASSSRRQLRGLSSWVYFLAGLMEASGEVRARVQRSSLS
jgi:hypothetical protein